MVDFANSNLCGASPAMNDLFKKLDDAAADIESNIDAAASEATAAFASAQNELNSLTAKLQSIEIPQLPKLNLQAEIKSLSELIPGTPAYISSLATITKEFGADLEAAGKDLGTLISDGISAITSGGNICNVVPNVEKEAGSDKPATEKATNVLQAAVAPETETVSKVTQNASVTEQTEEIEVDLAATQTPLKTGGEELSEDSGAYTVVEEKQVKTISTGAGETKVVPKKVEKAEDRKNVAPKSKSDGFTHVSVLKIEHFSSDDQFGAFDLADVGNGQTEIELKLKNVPIDGTIKITQYNLFENEVTTYETTSIGADGKPILGYKERYGIHGEIILWQSKSRFGQFQPVARITSLVGKKLIFQTPYSIEDDHPGDLESIILRGKGKRLSYFKSSMKGPKDAGHNRTDKGLNRRFKGKLFTVVYKHRSNYDTEVR